MKKTLLLLFMMPMCIVYAQKNSTLISINAGGSVTNGSYSNLGYNEDLIDYKLYPFSDGLGAENGYTIGVSTSYFLSKYIGLSLDWNYIQHDIISYPRSVCFQNTFGDYYSGYEAYVKNGWTHNTLNVGAHVSFPIVKDKFFIDFKSMIGFSSYTTPSINETVFLTDDTELTYNIERGDFTSMSTKFEVGMKYFIKNFGIGLYFNSLMVYSSESLNSVGTNLDYYIGDTGEFGSNSDRYYIKFNPSMLNYGLNLTYRIQKK